MPSSLDLSVMHCLSSRLLAKGPGAKRLAIDITRLRNRRNEIRRARLRRRTAPRTVVRSYRPSTPLQMACLDVGLSGRFLFSSRPAFPHPRRNPFSVGRTEMASSAVAFAAGTSAGFAGAQSGNRLIEPVSFLG